MITDFPISFTKNNVGSILKFWFIPIDEIDIEPEIYNLTLMGDYTFLNQLALRTGYFDKDTAVYDNSDATNKSGSLRKNNLSASISDASPELDSLFCEMKCKRFIVFFADNNKNVRVLGRKNEGAFFEFSFTSKENRKDAPIYSFKFYTETSCVLPITTTQITEVC